MQIDRRSIECRAAVEGSTVSGLAIPYGTDSQPLPFIETIERGAFREDLGKRNVALLVEHDGGRVLADTRSGTRPSFTPAAPPAIARTLFDDVVARARGAFPVVATGVFGADMKVHLINDGPVTFWLSVPPPAEAA